MLRRRNPPRPRTPAEPYADRLSRVRALLGRRRLDGYLVLDRMDQYWLTGFTGEDGGVLVTDSAVVLLTDGRFEEAADLEAPWARRVIRRKRGPDSIARVLKRYKLRRVGFEPAHMNVELHAELRKLVRRARLVPGRDLIGQMRLCKDEFEIAAIRRAIHVAQQAFELVRRWVAPGRSERQIAARLSYELQRRGAQGPAFAPIVAAGANASRPHYQPGDARIRAGDGVLIDWGARVGWYVSDLTRMVWPASMPRSIGRIYNVVKEAHDRAIAVLRPGVKASAVDRVARQTIGRAGFGKRFNHALGHGIGLSVHEGPRLGRGAEGRLRPGMVVTIEPGVYLPGQGGVRIESDVLVTESGCEVLSTLPY